LEAWKIVIFCDEPKMMLYSNNGPKTIWRKPLEALNSKHIIPTIKFGKLSVMVWGYISSKGVGELKFIEENMTKEIYLDILRIELTKTASDFGFIDDSDLRHLNCKFYQDNDPKHTPHLC